MARDLIWVNIGWSIINLLPILPMDGGRADRRSPPRRSDARQPARPPDLDHRGGLGAAVALFYGMTFAAVLGVLFAVDNYRAYQRLR